MITIHKCEKTDEAGARNLILKIMSEEFPHEQRSFPTDDLKEISDSYGKLGEAFFVACENGRVVGTVGVKQEDERTAMLRRFFVDRAFRGKRVGTQLLSRAITFCREVGYDELIFKTTSAMERAVRLCEKQGFIHRAKLNIGSIQLLKCALFLKGEPAQSESQKTASS